MKSCGSEIFNCMLCEGVLSLELWPITMMLYIVFTALLVAFFA